MSNTNAPELDLEQRQRAVLIAESRGIDLETAYELVYLRDVRADTRAVPQSVDVEKYIAEASAKSNQGRFDEAFNVLVNTLRAISASPAVPAASVTEGAPSLEDLALQAAEFLERLDWPTGPRKCRNAADIAFAIRERLKSPAAPVAAEGMRREAWDAAIQIAFKRGQEYLKGIGAELSDECKRELRWQGIAANDIRDRLIAARDR